MLKHYYRLVYWKRRLTRSIPGAEAPARAWTRRLRRGSERLRPLMVFAAMVLVVVGVSYGIGAWETGGSPRTPQQADPQAVCERIEDDCPGDSARETCRKLLAQARQEDSGANGPQVRAFSFIGCSHDD
ncbi:hypothetical protein OG204_11105 [Streptomyces sp. NBC_01387]|uniref:hypothetical protein n=1 Tax=Streptomyces sp. NBC_01387 TaxID=2903849 RepID=UPI003249887D